MKKVFLILLVAIVSISSCEKRKHCKGRTSDTISGIIVSNHDFGECFQDYIAPPPEEYVINDTATYNTIGLYRYTSKSNCQTATYPIIDFSQYTLLGKYATGGCNVGYKREVTRDDVNKKYIYTVTVCNYGMCKVLRMDMNWVLVPKLPQGYTVEFIKKEY